MTTREPLPLDGCRSTPLASYLKALGVLRLISSDANSASGKAADPGARGRWEDERFVLQTSLDRDALLEFLLRCYSPTPIIAPWNGGSGFYPKDNKDGFVPLSSASVACRFRPLSSAIVDAQRVLARLGLKNAPKGNAKVDLVAALRAEASDSTVSWLDAALALTGDSLSYPQLLGTGANDGRLDFTSNFLRRLASTGKPSGLFDASSGEPRVGAAGLLAQALFGTLSRGFDAVKIGQFAPGSAGGPNGTTGYKGGSSVNAWDFLLMLEGSVSFAGAATRRLASLATSGSSFPFTVRLVGAGSGSVAALDEQDARAEFWAPLWARPARSLEVDALLTEGRAVLNGKSARDGLEFARAVTNLGVSRGFSAFERFGFVMRSGRSFLATPLGRRSVDVSPASSLVEDLDRDGWLERVRRSGRAAGTSATGRTAIKRLEDAVFALVESSSPLTVQRAIIELGRVCCWLSTSPKGRELSRTPPPPMTRRWFRQADDESPEFRVAAALAGLGLDWRDPAQSEGRVADDSTSIVDGEKTWPMALHFGPVSESGFMHRRTWANAVGERNVVWGSDGLIPNMLGVLERRLVEGRIRELDDKPLGSATCARRADVVAFLSGTFDDARCAALLAGLIWVRPTFLRIATNRSPLAIPFAFAALKPIFTPDWALRDLGVLPAGRLPVPLEVLSRLRTARGVDEAVRIGLGRARSAGIACPFYESWTRPRTGTVGHPGFGVSARRLAAALLIPLDNRTLKDLIDRAYPGAIPDIRNTTEDVDNDA